MIRSIIQSILDAVRSDFTLGNITKYDEHQGYLITISHYSEKDSYLLADLSYIIFELEFCGKDLSTYIKEEGPLKKILNYLKMY